MDSCFEQFILNNGLRVIIKRNNDVNVVTVNVLYNVGSKNDFTGKFGLAHLYEHLMFCGSQNAKSYDEILQTAGGSNNAYTNFDVTNYYCTTPCENLETAIFLEADRMFGLNVNEDNLAVQKKVVIEELKESYFSNPYGDAFLHLMPLAYDKQSGYGHPIIGNSEHIQSVTLDDIYKFSNTYYRPNNAILVIVGNVELDHVRNLCDKYFNRHVDDCEMISYNADDQPITGMVEYVKRDIPLDAFYLAYHIPGKLDEDYYTTMVLSKMLGYGRSSFLYRQLVENRKLCNSIETYTLDNMYMDLLIVTGFVNMKYNCNEVVDIIQNLLHNVTDNFSEHEVEKSKNNITSSIAYDSVDVANYADIVANLAAVNETLISFYDNVNSVTMQGVVDLVHSTLLQKNSSRLVYERSGVTTG